MQTFKCLLTAALLSALLHTTAALAEPAEAYPDRPVTFVVPTAAAGGTDMFARLFAEKLGKVMGRPFVVDNRPGANGILGTGFVARAVPDGHTLLFTYAAAFVGNPSLYKNIPYDTIKDFAPIAQIARGGTMLLVRADLPVKTVQEFAAYVKERPNKLNYCSWGNGSGGHLMMENLKTQTGMQMLHIPYKGGPACIQDLLGGQVDAAFGDVTSNVGFVRTGRLRALALSGPSRMPLFPDVPTLNEAGYKFTTYAWYGVFAPASTSPAIVQKLNVEINSLLRDPGMQVRLRELNLVDFPIITPEQFSETVKQDLVDWSRLVKDANVKID